MTTNKIPYLVFIAVLTLALAGCNGPNPAATACVDFEAPLVLGTYYGSNAGQQPGDVAFGTADGITVTVEKFYFTNGGNTFGSAHIVNAFPGFGKGQIMQFNNLNLGFDFGKLGFTPSLVTQDVLDMGGFENISVNGYPTPPFAGELASAPNPLGSVSISFSPTTVPTPPVGKRGPLTLKGAVTNLTIGGQEFSIDNVCVYK